MRAKMMKEIIEYGVDDITCITIGEALILKTAFNLTNFEAAYIFLGGVQNEGLQV